ncbi:MAG: hypothetical protein ACRDVZ_12310 [Jiangellaceae bacterium]
MDALSIAAEQLGVTPRALQAALDRGETIASLAQACGLDADRVREAIVDAEVSDVEALGPIAGFSPADVGQFVREISAYLREFVERGQLVADGTVPAAAA